MRVQKPRPDLLTLSTTFYDLSVSQNLYSKAEIRQFRESGTEGLKRKYDLGVNSDKQWLVTQVSQFLSAGLSWTFN